MYVRLYIQTENTSQTGKSLSDKIRQELRGCCCGANNPWWGRQWWGGVRVVAENTELQFSHTRLKTN